MLYSGLLFIPYLIVAVLGLLESYWLLLPILSLPLATKLSNECWHSYSESYHDDNRCHHGNSKRENDQSSHENSKCNHNDISSNHDDNQCDHSNKSYHGNNKCNHGNLDNIPQKTAMLNLVFGILYVGSFLIAM